MCNTQNSLLSVSFFWRIITSPEEGNSLRNVLWCHIYREWEESSNNFSECQMFKVIQGQILPGGNLCSDMDILKTETVWSQYIQAFWVVTLNNTVADSRHFEGNLRNNNSATNSNATPDRNRQPHTRQCHSAHKTSAGWFPKGHCFEDGSTLGPLVLLIRGDSSISNIQFQFLPYRKCPFAITKTGYLQ